jgi:hypothetical protein
MYSTSIGRICRISGAIALVAALTAGPCDSAAAAIFHGISSDGHDVSATVDFTSSGDLLMVKLTNTTPTTSDVKDLLTGVDFQLSGLTPTLVSLTGVSRTINVDGSFADGGAAHDLSWSLKSLGSGIWELDSHPNARDAIVGPPSGGSYAGASRSVRGNPGHNPLAAETIIAVLNVPGLQSAAMPAIVVTGFGFASFSSANSTITPGGPLEVPEPVTWVAMCLMFAVGRVWLRPRR